MEIDKKELEQNNGNDGKPTYVAVDGKIYDLSESRLWKKGIHMNRHRAGQDLSGSFAAAPHGKEVLQRFTEKGTLNTANEEAKLPVPKWIANFLEAYPFLKRHPHPMVVHFPMTFFITSSIFILWYYLIKPVSCLIDSILFLHILGTISLPFAIITGWLSWKVNYLGKSIGYITRKIILTAVVVIFDIIVLITLINRPEMIISPQGIQVIIPIFIILYLPIVAIIGHHGGQLVY